MAVSELTQENFSEEIAKSGVAVIEFYSETCSVCKLLLPVLEELAGKHRQVRFYKINAQQARQLCLTYRVLSLPTTLFLKSGNLVEKATGFKNVTEMDALISKA
ncbi:thioredoxin [Lucifera butyrica]|uniref:Thioredoxin n=1 Tax=Lucifera butyrica TaxID=1351585 RepID=A0A498RBD0_9FIRM|nr:thioredoxin family protein [Lucifera butyrica]VBB06438.1 thioredoxin [Lucifera butyrica]